jgi:hypothetical protein
MKRAICVLAIGLMFVLGSNAAQAATPTPINGLVSGLELCPQFICGFAAFTGTFHGQIGNNLNTIGIVSTALTHGDLPTSSTADPAPIYRGIWKLQTLSGPISGVVIGGSIAMTPDISHKLFHVVILLLTSDFKPIVFIGTLDHRPLIPQFEGTFTSL